MNGTYAGADLLVNHLVAQPPPDGGDPSLGSLPMSLHPPAQLVRFILRSSKRIAVLVIGVALLAAGAVMLVVPGPGLLVIIGGLVVLATEFAWAEAMLDRARDTAARAKSTATGRFRRR